MKNTDNNKSPFDKKNLVKLAPAAVVIAAVAAAGTQIMGVKPQTATEEKTIVNSQELGSWMKTAYSDEDEDETESGKNKSSSTDEKNSKTTLKKGGIQKGASKILPVKSAEASGQGQGTTTTPTTEVPEDGYKDGTYQGSGTGFGGTITVQVTVSGGKITAIDILSASGETGSYLSSATGVISRILSSQSPNVDAISGATYSSNGIIQAVQNALGKAAGGKKTTPTPTPKPSKKPKQDTTVNYKDGVFEGQAEGFDGIVTVQVTIKKGKIKKITNTNTDTPEFFNKAWSTIKADVLARQSLSGVDTVSGATFSSNGILGALSQALSQANADSTAGEKGEITPVPTQIPVTVQPTEAPQPTASPDAPADDSGNENPDVPSDYPSQVKTWKDGTYSASAYGYSGMVNISLTVEDGKITEIANTNSETRSFFNKAWRKIQPQILEKQSAEGIDTVSGATFSSTGILDATKAALEQARNTEEKPSVTPQPTSAPQPTGTPKPTDTPQPTNTPQPTSAPQPTEAPQPTNAPKPTDVPQPTSVPQPTEAPQPTRTPEPTEAPEPVPAGVYKDGTYTGIGEGNDGPDSVQVTVTIAGGQIASATYTSYDDEDYVEDAWNGILGQVLGNQSADGVDTVSGCTYSSKGIIQAFKNALNQAKGA